MSARPETTPSNTRYYMSLVAGAGGTMLDVALVVLGSVLLGLAVAVLLDGFELVSIGLELSTGAMLGSSLVIGILGGFSLGVAAEGPLGRGRRLRGHAELEVAVARAVTTVLVGAVFLLLGGYLSDLALDLPVPFEVALDGLRAVAVAGMTVVPLVGVPLAWWARSGGLGSAFAADGDIPLLYFVWAIGTMVVL